MLSWLLLMVQGLVAAPKNDDLCFDATVCDFGTVVRENTIHTHVFHFENQSEEPVVILGVQTSCSCLKTEYSRRPLQKGEKGAPSPSGAASATSATSLCLHSG